MWVCASVCYVIKTHNLCINEDETASEPRPANGTINLCINEDETASEPRPANGTINSHFCYSR